MKMKNKIVGIIFFLAFYNTIANAQQVFTLEQCIAYGISHHNSIKNAELDQQAAKAKVRELIGVGVPQISAEASFNNFLKLPVSLVPAQFFGGQAGDFAELRFGTNYRADIGINASQLIFDGSYFVGLQAAKTYRDLADKQHNMSKSEVVVNIQKAYYTVLINNERDELLAKTLSQLDSNLKEMKAIYQAGFIEKVDVDRLQVSYNNLAVQHQKILRLKELSYILLKFQMGMSIKESLDVKDKITDIHLKEIDVASYSYNDRPDYKLFETQKRLAVLDLRNYRVKYLPSLVGFFNNSYNAQRDVFNFTHSGQPWFRSTSWGLGLNVPIFDGLQKHQKIQQSKLSLMKIENNMEQLINAIDTEVSSNQMQLKNSLDDLNIQKQNQDLATEIYRISKEKYKAGIGSNLEVLNAESSKVEADNNYYNALYNTLISKVDLEKSMGKTKY